MTAEQTRPSGCDDQAGNCGRCQIMPAAPGGAWCIDCRGESSYSSSVAGVDVSQLDPAEVRYLGCQCPAGKQHNNTCPAVFI